MPLYLFSSQMPELKHLPSLEREEIVEAAVFSLPITLRGLLTFSGVILPMTAFAFALSLILGRWVAYACLPVGHFVICVVFLNLAQEQIRELLKARADPKGLHFAQVSVRCL
jgi:hypothetical protein